MVVKVGNKKNNVTRFEVQLTNNGMTKKLKVFKKKYKLLHVKQFTAFNRFQNQNISLAAK